MGVYNGFFRTESPSVIPSVKGPRHCMTISV
jgi:hypothetical protein